MERVKEVIKQQDMQTVSEALAFLSKTIKEWLENNLCPINLERLQTIQKQYVTELIDILYSKK